MVNRDNIMSDGNTIALEKHLSREEDNELKYQSMLDEIEDTIGFDLATLNETFNKIVKSHGFEDSFIDYVADI